MTIAGFIGEQGPRFILGGEGSSVHLDVTLPVPLDRKGDGWDPIKDVREDINHILRKDIIGYRYKDKYIFHPIFEANLQYIRRILSWEGQIICYPYADVSLAFPVFVDKVNDVESGTYGITVQGVGLVTTQMPDLDAMHSVELGATIAINDQDLTID